MFATISVIVLMFVLCAWLAANWGEEGQEVLVRGRVAALGSRHLRNADCRRPFSLSPAETSAGRPWPSL